MKASSTRKKVREKDFIVKYEFMPSKNNRLRLQQAYAIIFEKIIKTEENSQINQKHLVMSVNKN